MEALGSPHLKSKGPAGVASAPSLRASLPTVRGVSAGPPPPSTTDGPSASKAADLASHDWAHKFAQIKMSPDGTGPARGEISRVARLAPAVDKETLRRRFLNKDTSATVKGPPPALGVLEKDLVEWLKAYKSLGVHIYTVVVREKARRLAKAAGIEYEFVASTVWLEAFCNRNGLLRRQGQFLEKERVHAVSREAVGRWLDLLEMAIKDVRPENVWMLDEVHVNLLDTGGYEVRLLRAPTPRKGSYPLLPPPPQVLTFGEKDYPSIPSPDTSKHISFLACVNARGKDSTPTLVFQGVRGMSKFGKGFPEARVGMDPAGYMSCELFLSFCQYWEADTRPADGAPRLLLFDGHFSHMAIDGVVFLHKHNVRVLTVHPHTTHLTCVLDNGPFKRFNWFLRDEVASLSPPGTAASDSNVAGCVGRAWKRTLEIVKDPRTGKDTSPVISAFAKTGIVPYSRAILERPLFAASDKYKEENDKSGKTGAPTAKRPQLTLTPQARQKIQEELLSPEKVIPPAIKARLDGVSRTQMSELLTSSEWLDKNLAARAAKEAVQKEEEDKRKKKQAEKDARGGLTKTQWKKAQSAAAAAAKAASKTAAQTAPAAPAPPPAVPKAPKVAKAAPKAAPTAPAGDPYAKPFARARGQKRARDEEE